MAGRRPKTMTRATVAAALQRELDEIAKVDPDLATGTLAAAAMSLARRMDEPSTSAAGASQCARALREITAQLRALAGAIANPEPGGPPVSGGDRLDDLAAARAKRRAAATSA